MKVYLDDERTTPEGWVRVYWPDEAIELLASGYVAEIDRDHDLGNDDRGTGYDVVLWIEEQAVLHGFVPPKMSVHSANVSARLKMEAGIRAIIAEANRHARQRPQRWPVSRLVARAYQTTFGVCAPLAMT